MSKKRTGARKKTTKKSRGAARKKKGGGSAKKFRILSIDGGGIRGIIPGKILAAVEKHLQKATDDPDLRIADCFDMIAGTSTGGILSCIYLADDPSNPGRPRFTAEEAVGLYLDRGDEVFDLSLWRRILTLGQLRDEKYSADGIEEALDDYFGETRLRDLLKPTLITAYDMRNRHAHFFRQHRAHEERMDFLVKDVARATSAAPTYFEPARVKSMSGVPFTLIDGGLFANNPAMCAYAEARRREEFRNPTAKDMVILSLGTGEVKKRYFYKDYKDAGLLEWVTPLLDIMMGGVAETTDYQMQKMFQAVKAPDQYLRINIELLDESTGAMDNASPENVARLESIGQEAADRHWKELTAFVEKLPR